MKLQLEIRAAEGGDDAKALVLEQAALYESYAKRVGLSVLKKAELGWLSLLLEGDRKALEPLLQEAGGHRWQRIPPNDRKKRVHSSTVTVSVYEPRSTAVTLALSDVEMRFTRDRGPGGQHKNKTESCVVLTHRPTGITVKVDGRDQHANRRQAQMELERRVREQVQSCARSELAHLISKQVGSGQRGDKVRTYRVQDGRVTDHRTGLSADLRLVQSGRVDALWNWATNAG